VDPILNNHIYYGQHAQKATTKAHHNINLRANYMNKYHWNGTIVDAIWWKSYGESEQMLDQLDKKRIQTFINDTIPTNTRAHQYCRDQPAPLVTPMWKTKLMSNKKITKIRGMFESRCA
jgi:hypothetical protein